MALFMKTEFIWRLSLGECFRKMIVKNAA